VTANGSTTLVPFPHAPAASPQPAGAGPHGFAGASALAPPSAPAFATALVPTPPTPGPAGGGGEPSSLVAHDVSCWFGSRKVIDRASLSMKAGRVTALIGPSGCGKSTFLRTLNRMHELIPGAASAGQVLLNGVDIYGPDMGVTQARLRIGMVFQRPNPFMHMTIAQNVLSGLKLAGLKSANRDALVQSCLERAGLWKETRDRLNAPGGGLSGGQQQRLCIARALAVSPQVLLMDEPCSALDPTSTLVIEETVRVLCHEVTVVIVTHNMQQAQRVADDTALFLIDNEGDPGRIVEAGPTDDVFNRPKDPRTSDYVHGRFG
jgi:phosphate transport system ATP-binding protein